ncbi:DUF2325 domain-containing protein [Novispirillum sp. DQ9]
MSPVRRRLEDIPPGRHCSLIGTCLSLADLRKLAAKTGLRLPPAADDYRVHGAMVHATAHSPAVARLAGKMLDKRYAAQVSKFSRATDEAALAALWDAAVAAGDIPGAYWALMTHPCDCPALRDRAFGEVHMLSHLSGASQRADLRRLAEVDRKLAERQAELDAARDSQARLARRVDDLTRALDHADIHRRRAEVLEQRVADLEAGAAQQALRDDLRAARESRDLALLEADRQAAAASTARAEADARRQEVARLTQRVADLELRLREREHGRGACAALADEPLDLGQRAILYVGGRTGSVAHLEALVTRANGRFLYHDGGVEDGCPRLAGAVSQADVVLCPVTCVSHEAVGHLKRNCRRACKRFLPLPSHSVTALMRGLRVLDAGASVSGACDS